MGFFALTVRTPVVYNLARALCNDEPHVLIDPRDPLLEGQWRTIAASCCRRA
jgi:hypothetical protein